MMPPAVRIFLIGMPGAGKSTVARLLGRELGLDDLDLDHEIEKSECKTVADIFRESGEHEFRRLEAGHLRQLIATGNSFVLATGGGTPCYHGSMEVMNEAGVTVYLDVPLDVIARRLSATHPGKAINQRPLMEGADQQEINSRVNQLDKARRPVYSEAKLQITGSDNLTDIVAVVREYLRPSGN